MPVNNPTDFSYAIADMNFDGVPELMLSAMFNGSMNTVYRFYTFKDGKAVRLADYDSVMRSGFTLDTQNKRLIFRVVTAVMKGDISTYRADFQNGKIKMTLLKETTQLQDDGIATESMPAAECSDLSVLDNASF